MNGGEYVGKSNMQSYNSLWEDEEGLLLQLIDFGPQGWMLKKHPVFNLSKLIYNVWISNKVKIHAAIVTSRVIKHHAMKYCPAALVWIIDLSL